MKKPLLILALMFVVLSAHAQEDFNYDVNNDGDVNVTDVMLIVEKVLGVNKETTKKRPIIIEVSERPLVYPTAARTGLRRAPAFTTSSLKSFYFNIMYKNQANSWMCSETTETFQTVDGKYENNGNWPANDPGTLPAHVFAFKTSNKASFDYNSGNPYLDISTEISSSAQCDVLVAKTDAKYNACLGKVSLAFDHVCAALQFSVKKTSSLAAYDVEVNEIVLHNVKKSGRYMLLKETDQWTEVTEPSNFSQSAYLSGVPDAITINEEETLLAKDANDYLFLIPQEIIGMDKGTPINEADQSQKAYLEIKCKIYDKNNEDYKVGGSRDYGSVYLPFSTNLTEGAGHVHPFVISIGTAIRDANGNKIIN